MKFSASKKSKKVVKAKAGKDVFKKNNNKGS